MGIVFSNTCCCIAAKSSAFPMAKGNNPGAGAGAGAGAGPEVEVGAGTETGAGLKAGERVDGAGAAAGDTAEELGWRERK